MERIFEALHEVFEIAEDAEITVEANPGTVTQEKLSAYRNLVSIVSVLVYSRQTMEN